MSSDVPVNGFWIAFMSKLQEGLEKYVPSKLTKLIAKSHWITRNIRIHINKLKKLYRRQKGSALESRDCKFV